MISFFRRIRQQLLSQSKVSKYLLYALGEIALVMIGILLAVQVNEWNTHRRERKEEQQVLRQLKTEFETNRAQIQDKILLHREIVSSGLRILEIIDAPDKRIPMDSLYFNLNRTLTAPTFDASLGVTNDLINSGKLYLIRNDALRLLISGWSGDIVFATEEEFVWRKVRDEQYIPFLIEKLSFRNIIDAGLEDTKYQQTMQFGKTFESLNTGPSRFDTISLQKLPPTVLAALEDQAMDMINFNHISMLQMTELRKVVDRILLLIDQEMERSE